MKKCLLLISLIAPTAQAKLSNPTSAWNKQYGIKQLNSADKNALATGLYNLLTEKGNEKTTPFSVSQFHTITNGTCDYKCRNAFQKVFEKTVLASHGKDNKEQVWIKNVLPYYADVISKLSKEEKTISFGKDRGKKLPETLFELDKALNPRTQYNSVLQIHSARFSIHIQM